MMRREVLARRREEDGLRITIVMGPFLPLPPGPAGAVEVLWRDLGNQFAAQGHEVVLVCRGWGPRCRDVPGEIARRVELSGYARSGWIWADLIKDLLYSLEAVRTAPPGDIIVTNAFWLPIFTARRRRKLGHTVISVERYPKGQLRLYRQADRLCAPTRAIRDAIVREVPGLAERVVVIPNPVNVQIFHPPGRVRNFSRARKILYTGRVHPEKGIHLLVRAFRRVVQKFPDSSLDVVGPVETDKGGGGPAYLKQLQREAAGLRVSFRAPVFDRMQLVRLLHSARVFCYPSLAERGESFGLAPLEAMATGLPVVVSDLGCFRDFVEHGRTGLVFDHRGAAGSERLARALETLLSDASFSARLALAAAEKAQEFSVARVAEMFLDDFEELLSGSRT